MREGVYVHKYLGCLCTYENTYFGSTEIYGFIEDEYDGPGYGFILNSELLTRAPKCWTWLGAL